MSRYRFASKSGTLAKFISKKTRGEFVDLPKVWCEKSALSAPPHLMSVVEGRQVIVSYTNKNRSVISALSFKFSSPASITASCFCLVALPRQRLNLVERNLSVLRGSHT